MGVFWVDFEVDGTWLSYKIGERVGSERGVKDALKFEALAPDRMELRLAGPIGQPKGKLGDTQELRCSGDAWEEPADLQVGRLGGMFREPDAQYREPPPEDERASTARTACGAREGPALQLPTAPRPAAPHLGARWGP